MEHNDYRILAKYIDQFANLKVNINSGSRAPHKPIMLLTVIALIDSGDVWENAIRPTDKVRAIFEAFWLNYVPRGTKFDIAPWTPFWHLKNEPFWHFKTKVSGFGWYKYYQFLVDKCSQNDLEKKNILAKVKFSGLLKQIHMKKNLFLGIYARPRPKR